MNDNRHDRLQETLREVAAEFLVREANRNALITVTRVILSDDMKRAHIYITVLPDSYEKNAVEFANRNRGELRDFFRKKVRAVPPSDIIFEIDLGEKNRLRLDFLGGNPS